MRVKGNSNVTAGRDVVFSTSDGGLETGKFKEIFHAADRQFCLLLVPSGVITRKDKEIAYSSEELFTSLMQIGIPFEPAIKIPFEILQVLEEIVDDRQPKAIDTSDIRVAVVRCISALVYGGRTDQEVAMWSTAYVRRFGNPANQFVKVVDNGIEKDLNYRYLREKIVPHVIRRILGGESLSNPVADYRTVFSNGMIDRMCQEIIHTVNTLNIYSIRYRTLIHLIEDLGLEPPHPWLVNPSTISRVSSYNAERAAFHLDQIAPPYHGKNPAFLNQSARECIRHLCATILTRYGAFLGVGSRYGLQELRRLLELQKKNPELWDYCQISKIAADLQEHGFSVKALAQELERVQYNFNADDRERKFLALQSSAEKLAHLVRELFPDIQLPIPNMARG